MKFFIAAILSLFALNAGAQSYTVNVMGPLIIGDVKAPDGAASEDAWAQFRQDLLTAKRLGAQAISIDIWWGLVEARESEYNWDYYDKVVRYIASAGLDWVPILSFHQLGGNVGDVGFIPPPEWVWTKYIGQPGVVDADSLKFKSEQRKLNGEYVSFWGTRYVIQDYARFMAAFQNHFADRAAMIRELNISLGPAGELRHPSYNTHDANTGYGTRGALQVYSDLAIAGFQNYLRRKYVTIGNLNAAWGSDWVSFTHLYPPDPSKLAEFFATKQEFSAYGKDFYDWNNQSPVDHGFLMLSTAVQIFNSPNAAFRGIPIGGKLPGVHWHMGKERLPELNAGLIRTSYQDWNSDENGHGYANTLNMFKRVSQIPGAPPVHLHFTALEMEDGRDGPDMGSLAKSLVRWIGDYATRIGLEVKGENALAEELNNPVAWMNIRKALLEGRYTGITLLRLGPLLKTRIARQNFSQLTQALKAKPCGAFFE